MEDEGGIPTEQPGGIDSLSEQIGSKSGGFSVVPKRLHGWEKGGADLGEGGGEVKASRGPGSLPHDA